MTKCATGVANPAWRVAHLDAASSSVTAPLKSPTGLAGQPNNSAGNVVPQTKPGQGANSTMTMLVRKNSTQNLDTAGQRRTPTSVIGKSAARIFSVDGIQFIRHHFKSGKNFVAKRDVWTVIGEGPAGLQCVLSLLDKAKTQSDENIQQIVWYKARDERLRRHIVTVENKTSSIRAIENTLEEQILNHDMRHLLVEKKGKFDFQKSSAGEAKHVFLADGYNSASRAHIFFDGKFAKPKTSLVARCIVIYSGLQPIEGKLDADTGTKTPMSLGMLKKIGINEPEQFIDLLKLSFTGLIKSNQQQRLQDSNVKRFDPYIHGFSDVETFKSQAEQGIEGFFSQYKTPEELKAALGTFELTQQDIEKFSDPQSRKELFENFKDNVGKFAKEVKTEQGEIIFVPLYRKHSYFGMKGLSAKDDDTGQTLHLVGDAALGYAPGGPNIAEAMKYSDKIVSWMIDSEFDKNDPKILDRQKSSLTQEQWSAASYKEWGEKKERLSAFPSTSSIN
jgi:hypothetical protein